MAGIAQRYDVLGDSETTVGAWYVVTPRASRSTANNAAATVALHDSLFYRGRDTSCPCLFVQLSHPIQCSFEPARQASRSRFRGFSHPAQPYR